MPIYMNVQNIAFQGPGAYMQWRYLEMLGMRALKGGVVKVSHLRRSGISVKFSKAVELASGAGCGRL